MACNCSKLWVGIIVFKTRPAGPVRIISHYGIKDGVCILSSGRSMFSLMATKSLKQCHEWGKREQVNKLLGLALPVRIQVDVCILNTGPVRHTGCCHCLHWFWSQVWIQPTWPPGIHLKSLLSKDSILNVFTSTLVVTYWLESLVGLTSLAPWEWIPLTLVWEVPYARPCI
jgi:hypothetical protein